jgi:hypothetical protein
LQSTFRQSKHFIFLFLNCGTTGTQGTQRLLVSLLKTKKGNFAEHKLLEDEWRTPQRKLSAPRRLGGKIRSSRPSRRN